MSARVLALIQDFDHQPVIASGELRQQIEADRAGFVAEALETLPHVPESPGSLQVLRAIGSHPETLQRLTHPGAMSEEAAIGIARRLQALDPLLDMKLLQLLDNVPGWHASRVLQVVAAISDGKRIVSPLAHLLRHSDSRIRSKAALMIGQLNGNLWWVEQQMKESDPRVRANAVESLWGAQSREACALFRAAACDPSHRVAANAAVGLYRAGDVRLSRILDSMIANGTESFRAAAVWAMGQTEDPRFLPAIGALIAEPQGIVRQNAIRAMVRIRKRLQELKRLPPLEITARILAATIEVRVRPEAAALAPTCFVVCEGER